MPLAPSAVAALAVILTNLLALLGIEIGSDQMTTTIATAIAIVGGIVVWLRQMKTGRSTPLGKRPVNFRD